MAKIKKKVKMTLPELITWAWENDVREEWFYSDNQAQKSSYGVQFDEDGDFISRLALNSDLLFAVEIEENITEDTQIYRLLELKDSFMLKDGGWKDLNIMKSNMYGNQSISEVKNDESKNFYMLNEDGTLTLIWKDGELL